MKPNMINIYFLGGCDKDFEAMKDSNTLKKYVMDPVWRKLHFSKSSTSVLCTERIECTNAPYM